MENIEINKEFQTTFDLLEETNQNVLITGKAGTGKSTFLNYFRSKTKKKVVVLAPTGVAAINVRGQTIHSFFKFLPDITEEKVTTSNNPIYEKLDMIIIDEISMVRADLLDCVDRFLKINCQNNLPFGGKQMIFIGDLYQLPPVVKDNEAEIFQKKYDTPYFFSSRAFRETKFELIEFQKVYRQTDKKFIEILNAIRDNTISDEQLEVINSRYNPSFEFNGKDFSVILTPYNDNAKKVNEEFLSKLKGKEQKFIARITGKFDKDSYPADEVLYLKEGAQVMILVNHPELKYTNGTIGIVRRIESHKKKVIVETISGSPLEIEPYEWSIFEHKYDPLTDTIKTETLGTFKQIPLKLSWAVTIHKSQGKTFDKVIIDLGKGAFAPGQVYVALSRCTSLEGITLLREIKRDEIFVDRRIVEFLKNYPNNITEYEQPYKSSLSYEEKISVIKKCISEKKDLEILYLKQNFEESRRKIKPLEIGYHFFENKQFFGVRAFCYERRDIRHFRIDRILEIKVLD